MEILWSKKHYSTPQTNANEAMASGQCGHPRSCGHHWGLSFHPPGIPPDPPVELRGRWEQWLGQSARPG